MATEFDPDAVVQQVTETLAKKFPDTPADHITELVRAKVDELAHKPVHDYVAVLTEREVKKRLKSGA
jgi:hypothetical protein